MSNEPYDIDSDGNMFPKPEKSAKPRGANESPHDCTICGKPANSPASKRYCWEHYYQYTDGKVFDVND